MRFLLSFKTFTVSLLRPLITLQNKLKNEFIYILNSRIRISISIYIVSKRIIRNYRFSAFILDPPTKLSFSTILALSINTSKKLIAV